MGATDLALLRGLVAQGQAIGARKVDQLLDHVEDLQAAATNNASTCEDLGRKLDDALAEIERLRGRANGVAS
jgi:hypothetical protein